MEITSLQPKVSLFHFTEVSVNSHSAVKAGFVSRSSSEFLQRASIKLDGGRFFQSVRPGCRLTSHIVSCLVEEGLKLPTDETCARLKGKGLDQDGIGANFERELNGVLLNGVHSTKLDAFFVNNEGKGAESNEHKPTTSGNTDAIDPSAFTDPDPPDVIKIPAQSEISPPKIDISKKSKYVKASWDALSRWSRSLRSLNKGEENALIKTKKIAILGGGSFGTAMGVMLARNKSDLDVCLLLRNEEVCSSINDNHKNGKAFPTHQLPLNVRATTDPREALADAQYCIHAVPVQSSARFLQSIAEFVPPNLPILSVSKGLEIGSLEMMSQLIPRALNNPRQPIAVLSGPSFSIELMDELPTAIVAASKDKKLARAAQQLLASKYLRVNTSDDVVGVEMAGALKNVLAIAAGIVEGMNLGNNCMAALVAQGCAEIRWLAEKMGANPATLAGLAGTGDIMLTCFVNLSRNRSVGVRLGAGEKLEDILSSMSQVAEGVATASAVIALARKYKVQMPVLTAVAQILENELTPKQAVMDLMSLPQVEER